MVKRLCNLQVPSSLPLIPSHCPPYPLSYLNFPTSSLWDLPHCFHGHTAGPVFSPVRHGQVPLVILAIALSITAHFSDISLSHIYDSFYITWVI